MLSENRGVGLPWQMAFTCCEPLLLDIKRSQNVTRAFMSHQQWHIFLTNAYCMWQTWSGAHPKGENGRVPTAGMYFFPLPGHNCWFAMQIRCPSQGKQATRSFPAPWTYQHGARASPSVHTHLAVPRSGTQHVKNQPFERDLLIRSLKDWNTGTVAPQGVLRFTQLKLGSTGPGYLQLIPNDSISLERRKRSTAHTPYTRCVQTCVLHLLEFCCVHQLNAARGACPREETSELKPVPPC